MNQTLPAFQFTSTCSSQSMAFFQKGETILSLHDHTGRVGILIEGEANVIAVDENGKEFLLELLSTGDCFGEPLMSPVAVDFYQVQAATACTVAFINYDRVVYDCHNHCINHANLVKTLMLIISKRSQELSAKTIILSQGSIRGKLYAYLQYHKALYGIDEFEIPVSLSRLSEYLASDRTALMREIRKMNNEGIISSSERKFKILK